MDENVRNQYEAAFFNYESYKQNQTSHKCSLLKMIKTYCKNG
jgi:hypothetical protein